MMDIKEVDVNKSKLLRRNQAKIYHNKSCRYRCKSVVNVVLCSIVILIRFDL